MLRQYAIVLPLDRLSNATGLLAAALNWSAPRGRRAAPHANAHRWYRPAREAVLGAEAGLLRAHNAWDVRLYEWVERRYRARPSQDL